MIDRTVIETPAGFVGVAWTDLGLLVVNLPEETPGRAWGELGDSLDRIPRPRGGSLKIAGYTPDIDGLAERLNQYFSGKPAVFDDPVDFSRHTPFQTEVLEKVRTLQWGMVAAYGQVALTLGRPNAARAVGGAVGSNRALLVVPCHRVIAGQGIGGFGLALEWKRKLLILEGLNY